MKKNTNIGKKLLNNWALKLFSLVAAFLLWLVVMNIEDPEDRKTFNNIPVRLVNTDVLTDANMVYEILDKTDTVKSVTIVAKKTIRDELSASDIVAEADFSKLTVTNTVEIRFYSLRYNDEISSISGSNEILKLNIEEKKTKRLVLSVEATGEMESGYIINSVTPDQNRIEVSGPESVISKIASAGVKVDVSDSTSDISTYSDVILYDAEGNEISAENVFLNVESVRVRVEILKTKTVPIHYEVMGTPAAGYMFTGEIESMPDSVTIAGSPEVLAGINSVAVPEEALNITGQTEDMLVNVNIEEYLPEGAILADKNFRGKAAVTVHIEREFSKELTIETGHIRITNIPAGYTVELAEEEMGPYTLNVKGLKSVIDGLDTTSLYGHISMTDYMEDKNLEELSAGVYEAEVTFMFPDSIVVVQPLKVHIEITKMEDTE